MKLGTATSLVNVPRRQLVPYTGDDDCVCSFSKSLCTRVRVNVKLSRARIFFFLKFRQHSSGNNDACNSVFVLAGLHKKHFELILFDAMLDYDVSWRVMFQFLCAERILGIFQCAAYRKTYVDLWTWTVISTTKSIENSPFRSRNSLILFDSGGIE